MKEIFLLATLLFSVCARAEICADFFAMSAFNDKQCEQALSVFEHSKTPCLGWLWGTFGKSLKCQEKFMARFQNKLHTIRIHALNETCKRGGRTCERGREVMPGQEARRFKEVSDWVDAHSVPWTRAIITTGLEDNYTNAKYRRIRKKLNTSWLTARSPMACDALGYDTRRSDFIELHGYYAIPRGKACIFSTDGIVISGAIQGWHPPREVSFADMRWIIGTAKGACDFVFIWSASQDGGQRGHYIRPSKRHFRISTYEISSIKKLIKEFET